MNVGAESGIITGRLGAPIQGATVDRCAEEVRDDLEANVLFLEREPTRVLLVSCDLVGLPPRPTREARKVIARRTGIPERNIVIACTHTHSGPSVIPTKYGKPVDEPYLAELPEKLAAIAAAAVDNALPAAVAVETGSVQIGYNRRCCWADGSHSMHGDTTRPDFIGLEGPEDPGHFALFARNREGALIAVLHSNTSHPTCFYGSTVYSADFPGASRRFLRELYGKIPVLFFNGAFGDISIDSQRQHPGHPATSAEKRMLRAAHLLTGETLRLLHEAHWQENPELQHRCSDLPLPVRLPTPERLAWAQQQLQAVDRGETVPLWDQLFAFGSVLLQEEFGDNPTDNAPVHAIRIGDAAIVTQPCELFCRFGLDIKRRSPFAKTVVAGVADGYRGYCPTVEGIMGGGYSGEPIHWTRLSHDAGYRIVDEACRHLYALREEPVSLG